MACKCLTPLIIILLCWLPCPASAVLEASPTLTAPLPSLDADLVWIDMVKVESGSFLRGDAFAEGSPDERPQHSVVLASFYIAPTETTYAQWLAVRDWAVQNGYPELSGVGAGKGSDHPVHSVSWLDAVKWCNAASERLGLAPVYRTDGGEIYRRGERPPEMDITQNGFRLPTEAEWEYAARGGLQGKRYPWGDTISHREANYRANRSTTSYDWSHTVLDTYHQDFYSGDPHYTAPVGSFAPNAYGLYDAAGNVWEWCYDRFSKSDYPDREVTDPTGPETGLNRIHRGGSYHNLAYYVRTSFRSYYFADFRGDSIGFRLARSR